jgi:hypothetical protein
MPVRLGPFYVSQPIRSIREQAGYSDKVTYLGLTLALMLS